MDILDTDFLEDACLEAFPSQPQPTPKAEGEPAEKHATAVDSRTPSKSRYLLTALVFWLKSWSIPGMGMFCQAYFVFSISNVSAVFAHERPSCFKTYQQCSKNLVWSQTYAQFSAIIIGMLALGYLTDQTGRRRGAIVTACLMLLGGILLSASSGTTALGFIIMFIISQCVFGFGVGGEYGVAASTACERAEANRVLRHRRGEMVINTFSMQGWGAIVSTIVLILLVLIAGNHGSYDVAWRLTYIIGLVPIIFMIWFRVRHLTESKMWRKTHTQDWNWAELRMLWRHYWHRLIGASLAWFFMDVSYYGSKLFQSKFILVFQPHASLVQLLLWTLLYAGVAIVGYHAAALVVDRHWMGRVRLQSLGFMMCFILFVMCAWGYDELIQPQNIQAFMFLFFFSSFWVQFGPNTTTFLLAAETVPTPVRATAVGIAAASGKAGALLVAVLYHYISAKNAYLVSAFANLAGLAVTWLFMPNLTGVSLRDMDRRWKYIMQGRGGEYCGEAVNPQRLSCWENLRGLGAGYNADRDTRMKVDERKLAVSEKAAQAAVA